jgi:hypothetical protein
VQYFESLRNDEGTRCCGDEDGKPTAYDVRPEGYYIPPREDPKAELAHWILVPANRVVKRSDNPTGHAIVWWTYQDGVGVPRCFLPDSQV